jgi:lactoylglutathione lyase
MTETIHHVALAVRDLDRSVAFYVTDLGCRLVIRRRLEAGGYFARALGDPAAAASIAVVRLGSATLELVQWDPPVTPVVGGAHLCLLVARLDAELERLAMHGIHPLAPAQRIEEGPNVGGRIAWIRDPDGHRIELMELTPERRAARGSSEGPLPGAERVRAVEQHEGRGDAGTVLDNRQ